MSAPIGTNVGSPLAPSDSTDTYPTHKAQYGQGGLMSVADATARTAITTARFEEGMLCYQQDTDVYYKGLSGGTWALIDLEAGVTGIQGMTGVKGDTGIQGLTGIQGATGSGGSGTLIATGLTGLTSNQILVGNAVQHAGLSYLNGTLSCTGIVSSRYGTFNSANNSDAGIVVGMDGGNTAIIFDDLHLGSPNFDNLNSNDSAGTGALAKIIGGGLSTDGGLVIRSWGLTGVASMTLTPIVSCPKGTSNFPAIVIRAENTDGANGTTGLSNTSKLLNIQNYSTPVVTVAGNGNMYVKGDLNALGNVYTVGITGIPTDFVDFGELSTRSANILRLGNVVDFWFSCQGLSGVQTTRSVELPWQNNSATLQSIIYTQNAGVNSHGLSVLNANDKTLQFFKDLDGNGWTGGQTQVKGNIRYYTTDSI